VSYTVSAIEKKEINFRPETVVEEVLQNVWFILNTMEYDCPLARGLGLNPDYIDKPIEAAQALSVSDIYDKIELYEPRAEIQEISFEADHLTGRVGAVLEVEINGDYDKEYTE